MRIFIAVVFFIGVAPSFAATDVVFPWVSNNDLFRSLIVIDNLGPDTTVRLQANRPTGSSGRSSETETISVSGFDQMVFDAGDLFTSMGEGVGYSVRLTTESDLVSAALVVSSTTTISGDSPAQVNPVPANQASTAILFKYLPLDSGFSVPVVFNSGSTTDVTFTAYQGGKLVGSATFRVGSGKPYAETMDSMFPGLQGSAYVIAESGAPLIGTSFIFNNDREPSMATAIPAPGIPQIPPEISLESCNAPLCLSRDYDPVIIPVNVSATVTAAIAGINRYTVVRYRLTVETGKVVITGVDAEDSNRAVVPFIDGLEIGQVITAGTEHQFSFVSPLTNNQMADITFSVEAEGLGAIIVYRVRLRTN